MRKSERPPEGTPKSKKCPCEEEEKHGNAGESLNREDVVESRRMEYFLSQ